MKHPLELAPLYRLWQRPFVAQKVRSFRQRVALDVTTRVLDVGCGPATNASLFAATRYVGLDFDPNYVRSARALGLNVMVGDAGALPIRSAPIFDVVFVNSLLHHLTDEQVTAVMTRASRVLAPTGRLHVIDLHVPGTGIARRLALADRGEHPRELSHLRSLITPHFEVEHEETFRLSLAGIPLWAMVYFSGTPRGAA